MMEMLALASERLGLRRRVRLPCQVVRESDFALVSDLCLDISPRGMRVRALTPVQRGAELLVSFRVPDVGVHMDLSAVVSRVAPGRRRGESLASFGLSFVAISASARMLLSARLKGFPPPVPLRHLRVDYAAAVRAVHETLLGSLADPGPLAFTDRSLAGPLAFTDRSLAGPLAFTDRSLAGPLASTYC